MKHIGLFAFGVTTCVLVPTALHLLEAGPKQVAKLVAPGDRTITLGKAKIEATVDKAFLDAGDKLHVTLTASAEAHQKVTVAVLVLESTGTGGGRVETPPDRIGRDEITFDIPKDGKQTKTFAFTLPGNRGWGMDGMPAFGHYTILVMSPSDADEVEKLRRRAASVANPMMNDNGGRFGAWETVWYGLGNEPDDHEETKGLGKPGTIARLEVNTRPADSVVKISVPDTAKAGDDIAVSVKIKNPSKKAIDKVTVTLASKPGWITGEYLGIPEDQVTIAKDSQEIALAGHETKTVVFHVTPKTAGTLGLFARSSCDAENCYSDMKIRTLNDSALDAIEIGPADKAAPVVGSK